MATKVQVETRFGDLEMFIVNAPFDQAKTAIEAANGKLATAQQVAQARIIAGLQNDVSRYGSWVAENIVYFPNGQVILTRAEHSPILKHPSEATDAYRSRNEYFVSNKELEEIIKVANEDIGKKAEERRVYILEQTESYEIPIKKFAKDGSARFVFGETTADYATFLQAVGITEVPVWLAPKDYIKKQRAPFARALWLHRVYNGSDLYCNGRVLDFHDRVRGVRVASEANTYKLVA